MAKILIIEDDEAVRENTAELLGVNHYQVRTAENGRAGFAIAQAYNPDLILCDMMMPETDGRHFLKLAKDDAVLQHTPIVFFSAGTVPVAEQRKLIKASNGFLKKPFLEEDLLSTIQSVLAR